MQPLVIYALLTTAAFYLGSRAVITRFLWSRYPPAFARFMDCAACSGFWYGLIAAGALDLGPANVPPAARPVVIALCSAVWTPIVAGLMQHGFEQLGSAVEDPEDGNG